MTLRYGVAPALVSTLRHPDRARRLCDPHARLMRRFRQRIGLDCQSMPTSHAAVRHTVGWGTARRAERAFLEAWDRTRPKHRPRHLRVEIQRGKGQHFWTVLSDLVRDEVIGLEILEYCQEMFGIPPDPVEGPATLIFARRASSSSRSSPGL